MKEVLLKIPEHKFKFFMELIGQLGFEATEEVDIPEEHKAIVRERMKTAKAADFVSWEEARKRFTFKSKS